MEREENAKDLAYRVANDWGLDKTAQNALADSIVAELREEYQSGARAGRREGYEGGMGDAIRCIENHRDAVLDTEEIPTRTEADRTVSEERLSECLRLVNQARNTLVEANNAIVSEDERRVRPVIGHIEEAAEELEKARIELKKNGSGASQRRKRRRTPTMAEIIGGQEWGPDHSCYYGHDYPPGETTCRRCGYDREGYNG